MIRFALIVCVCAAFVIFQLIKFLQGSFTIGVSSSKFDSFLSLKQRDSRANNFVLNDMDLHSVGRLEILLPQSILHRAVSINLSAAFTFEFKDCVEISLLHFLQLAFFDFNNTRKIDLHRLLLRSKELYTFFQSHDDIFYDSSDWQLEQGQNYRTQWATFLCQRPTFDYKKNGTCEMKATYKNVQNFFEYFFQVRMENISSFQKICTHLSRPGYELTCHAEVSRKQLDENTSLQHHQYFISINGKYLRNLMLFEKFKGEARICGHAQMYMVRRNFSFQVSEDYWKGYCSCHCL